MFGKTNAGGSGGSFASSSDAVLKVLAPAGSTVSLTKGGLTKNGNSWLSSDDASNAVHLFSIKQAQFDSNPWTVSSILSGDTKTATITIDSSRFYETSLLYRIPVAYQEVAYLQSTGTQYINTGIAANLIGSGHIKGRIVGTPNYVPLFGACDATDAIENQKTFAWRPVDGNFYIDNGGYYGGSDLAVPANTDFEINFTVTSDKSTSVVIFNNINHSGESGTGDLSSSKITSRAVWLFACDYAGTLPSNVTLSCQIMEATFWDRTGNLLGDFIPCKRKSDNVAGFYNTAAASNNFKTNAGSGNFTVGANV